MSGPILQALERAVGRLEEVLQAPESAITRDAAIQRFEFCFELAWKAVQVTARGQGQECTSPKGCLREAFHLGWIQDEQPWVSILADRNLTSHTYDEKLAKQVFSRLAGYLPMFRELLGLLKQAR